MSYGQSFDRPTAKVLRRARHEGGERMFEAAELRRILDALKDDPQLRAMTLLGVNCGFGNTDVASLPQSALDLESGWCVYPRPKTEIPRRVPLWTETVEAVREAIAVRPAAKSADDDGLVFLTRQGCRWTRAGKEGASIDQLSKRFGGLLHTLGINGRRGLGFYTLRHVHQTIGGEARDPDAVSAIMGHVSGDMASVYRERISDERLRRVVEAVRDWLFTEGGC